MGASEQAFLDEVAIAAGKDPIDFRIELFNKAKNTPVGKDNDYDAERYMEVLKLVREKSNWDSPIICPAKPHSASISGDRLISTTTTQRIIMPGDSLGL